MKKLSLNEVIRAMGGRCNCDVSDCFALGVSTDSRKIKEGDLFFSLKGESFDGHKFAQTAFESGCAAVIASKEIPCEEGNIVIFVPDTLKALQDLAKYYLSLFDIQKIAITGSTGKTTTKEILYTILSSQYKTAKNIGNFNNHIGLPLTAMTVEEDHQVVIFEMGMSGLKEIDLMADIVKPHIAIITNVGISHIEKLGSRENILKAKTEITNYFHKDCTLILNGDDDMLGPYADGCKDFSVVKVGKKEGCHFQIIEPINNIDHGIAYDIKVKKDIYSTFLNMVGEHNAYNGTLAIAAANQAGIGLEGYIKAAGGAIEADKRLDVKECENHTKVIDDTYNASPDSMKAAIDVLVGMGGGRRIAILGDMFELGAESAKYHKEIGKYASNRGVDMVISVGEKSAAIHQGVKENSYFIGKALYFKTKEDLIPEISQLLLPQDIILVKASRGMAMEKVVAVISNLGKTIKQS